MLPELKGFLGNPSSVHSWGQEAKNLLSQSRTKVAEFFRVAPQEVVFTSGATESIHLFLHSLPPNAHIISTKSEHAAIYETILSSDNPKTFLSLDANGKISLAELENAIGPNSVLILSAANSETGIKIDLEKIACIAKKNQTPFFVDAVQIIGKEPFFPHKGISAFAISAHKFHGPKGIGALISRVPRRYPLVSPGGGQEGKKRSGTENLSGILALAQSLSILQKEGDFFEKAMRGLRDFFEEKLLKDVGDLIIHGKNQPRVCNTSNIAFLGVDGEALLIALDQRGIAASHGSACSAGALEPSRALSAMGIPKDILRSSIRFSLSRMNTEEEIVLAIREIRESVQKNRLLTGYKNTAGSTG